VRYKHETFTKTILKDGFISFLLNNIGTLYLSNGSGWNYRLLCKGRKTPEPCSCTRPCTSKSLNSVNATIISNTLQNTACPYLIYFTCYVSDMFHSTLMLRVEVVGFMFRTLCMYRRWAMERIVGMIPFLFPPLIIIRGRVTVLCIRSRRYPMNSLSCTVQKSVWASLLLRISWRHIGLSFFFFFFACRGCDHGSQPFKFYYMNFLPCTLQKSVYLARHNFWSPLHS
jgi:hypothetical protein